MKALITLAAVVSAVVVTAPAAFASSFITDTLGGSGHAHGYRLITDTLGGNGHAQATHQGYGFITDTLASGGGAPLAAAPSSPAFSWADAGIGAGAAAGALIILLGGTLLTVRRRDTITA